MLGDQVTPSCLRSSCVDANRDCTSGATKRMLVNEAPQIRRLLNFASEEAT